MTILGSMTDVELRHLAAMAAIAEEGSFGRAAARLGYTQSTVSQQIAALEKAVGGAVFDRPGGPKPVRITPLGAVVLEQGRELLAKAEALADAVDRFKAGDGRIDIGTFQSVSNVILPSSYAGCATSTPAATSGCPRRSRRHPQIGDLDLLFYDGPLDGDVEHVKLLDDPYLLVARRGDFPDGPVPLEQLDGAPMVAWPLDLRPALDGAGPRPRRRATADRLPHRGQRNAAVDGASRDGIGGAAVARRPRRRRRVRRPAPRPRAAAGPAATRDLPALAGRSYPLSTGGASDRDRRRGRVRPGRRAGPGALRSKAGVKPAMS